MSPGPPSRPLRRAAWAVPPALFVALCLPYLADERWKGDAGWYGAIARRAVHEGHWWTLWAADRPYFNKPPLGFWVHGAFLEVLGPSAWAGRAPTVLAGAAAVALTGAIARRLFGPTASLFSGVALAGTIGFASLADRLRLDFLLLALMLAAVWCVVSGAMDRRRWLVALAGVPLGLALLVKPLVALLAAPILLVWLLLAGRARMAPWLGLGVGVAVAVAAPWHVSMATLHGEAFTSEYFVRQSLERGLSSRFGEEPWWWYLGYLGRHHWPWLPAVGLGVWAVLAGRVGPGRRDGAVLALLWAGVWLVALSLFADKRKQYLLPVYPGLAWAAALGIVAVLPAAWARALPVWAGRFGVGAVAVSALATLLVVPRTRTPAAPEWGELHGFIGALGGEELWDGGLHYGDAGALYLNTGVWPRPRDGAAGAEPAGALVVYDLARTAPPAEAEVVFSSGRLVVARAAGADPGHNRPEP